jgi:hypothetical protein
LKYDGGGFSSFFALSAAGGFELLQPVRTKARVRLKIGIISSFILVHSFCINPDAIAPAAPAALVEPFCIKTASIL